MHFDSRPQPGHMAEAIERSVALTAMDGLVRATVPYERLLETSGAFRGFAELFDQEEFKIEVPGVTQALMQVVGTILLLRRSNDAVALDVEDRRTVVAALDFLMVPGDLTEPLVASLLPTRVLVVEQVVGGVTSRRDVCFGTCLCANVHEFAAYFQAAENVHVWRLPLADAGDGKAIRDAVFDAFMRVLDRHAGLAGAFATVQDQMASFISCNHVTLFSSADNVKAFRTRLLASDVSSACREALLDAAIGAIRWPPHDRKRPADELKYAVKIVKPERDGDPVVLRFQAVDAAAADDVE